VNHLWRQRWPALRATLPLLVVGTVLAAATAAAHAADAGAVLPVTVAFPDQQATLAVEARLAAAPASRMPFFRSADVAAIFRLHRGWDPVLRRLVLAGDGRRVEVTAGARLVRVDTVRSLLRLPPRYREGELWLPLELLTRILPRLTRQAVTWDAAQRRLTVRSWRPDIDRLDVTTGPRRTVLRLAARRPLRWRVDGPRDGRLRVIAAGATVDTAAVRLVRPRGMVTRIASRQGEDGAEVTVALSPLAYGVATHRDDGGRVLRIVLREEENTGVPVPRARGRHGRTESTAARPLDLVVIDPGHGGADAGATADGLVEKELALDLAIALRDRLKREGFRVALTRDSDATLGLDARTEAADRLGGDLLISLHADLWPDARPGGALVRYQAAGDDPGDGPFVRWEAVQQRHRDRSAAVADALAAALRDAGWPCRGVAAGDLPLLRGADMPAVLLETGLLSNPADRRRLASPRRRRALVDAVTGALVRLRAAWRAQEGEEEP